MTRRRWIVVVAAMGVAALAAALLWTGEDDDVTTSATGETTTTTTTVATSVTSSSTTTELPPTTATPIPPPSGVTVSAAAGAGSGEIAVGWTAVDGATGYRVLRASSADGPFSVAATIDTTTGAASAEDGVVNVWSAAHSYVPSDGDLGSPDPSSRFEYIDVGEPRTGCYRVVAFNSGGDAPASAPACTASR